jgi:hypothetical protein
MSFLEQKFGSNHSRSTLGNFVFDFVDDAIPPIDSVKPSDLSATTISDNCRKLFSDLRENEWMVHCVMPLFNFYWHIPENIGEKTEMSFQNEDKDITEQRLFPGAHIVRSEMLTVEDISHIADLCPENKELKFWLEIDYSIEKSKEDLPKDLRLEVAEKKAFVALLAMRLFARGNVGANSIELGVGRRSWQQCILSLDDKFGVSRATNDESIFQISLEDRSSLALASLADQLDLLFGEGVLSSNQIQVAIENFMISYSKNPVDRLEGYLRCLQGLFSCTGSIDLGRLTAMIISKNETEYRQIEERVVECYRLIRNKATHGTEAPSNLLTAAVKMISYVEEYCRQAILFLIALNRMRQMTLFLAQIKQNQSNSFIFELRKKAFIAFWKGRRILVKSTDGREVFLGIW